MSASLRENECKERETIREGMNARKEKQYEKE
jgi:hypothetical protein